MILGHGIGGIRVAHALGEQAQDAPRSSPAGRRGALVGQAKSRGMQDLTAAWRGSDEVEAELSAGNGGAFAGGANWRQLEAVVGWWMAWFGAGPHRVVSTWRKVGNRRACPNVACKKCVA